MKTCMKQSSRQMILTWRNVYANAWAVTLYMCVLDHFREIIVSLRISKPMKSRAKRGKMKTAKI